MRPVVAAAGTGVLVGAATVATGAVVDQTRPASLAFLRYGIALVCLAPALLLTTRVRFKRQDLLPIGLLGIGQFGVLIVLLNFGLQRLPSALAGLIFATTPLLTMLLSAAVGQERLRQARSLGVLLSVLGVGLALGDNSLREALSALSIAALGCVAVGLWLAHRGDDYPLTAPAVSPET